MAKFRFKLEALLKHRSEIERQKQQDLARAQSQMNELSASLAEAANAMRAANAQPAIDPHHQRFFAAMRSKTIALRRELAACETQGGAARAAFAAAAKDRKAIELLRNKDFAEYRKQQERVEQRQIDESAARLARGCDRTR